MATTGQPDARSFRVITEWRRAGGVVLGLGLAAAVLAAIHFLGPPALAARAQSQWGIVLLFTAGFALGEWVIAPRLGGYCLTAGPDGLHARAPGRGFPAFTLWHDVRDLTFTDAPPRSFRLTAGGRHRAEPGRRITLSTPQGSHSFDCREVEKELELQMLVAQRRQP